ncbi:hypothetical protein FIBSPDRAFT_891262 [Athelia psychrophila]|uniref:Uncharacterized protein n=1 Tax=Athelia psychrophila TaxID=1759441 RepID=A0A166JYJ5_9AGAM|nr:hypothetical protein FIBSPDRAFT_891262 [Fibularhizoctonia sp. CBS 109695]
MSAFGQKCRAKALQGQKSSIVNIRAKATQQMGELEEGVENAPQDSNVASLVSSVEQLEHMDTENTVSADVIMNLGKHSEYGQIVGAVESERRTAEEIEERAHSDMSLSEHSLEGQKVLVNVDISMLREAVSDPFAISILVLIDGRIQDAEGSRIGVTSAVGRQLDLRPPEQTTLSLRNRLKEVVQCWKDLNQDPQPRNPDVRFRLKRLRASPVSPLRPGQTFPPSRRKRRVSDSVNVLTVAASTPIYVLELREPLTTVVRNHAQRANTEEKRQAASQSSPSFFVYSLHGFYPSTEVFINHVSLVNNCRHLPLRDFEVTPPPTSLFKALLPIDRWSARAQPPFHTFPSFFLFALRTTYAAQNISDDVVVANIRLTATVRCRTSGQPVSTVMAIRSLKLQRFLHVLLQATRPAPPRTALICAREEQTGLVSNFSHLASCSRCQDVSVAVKSVPPLTPSRAATPAEEVAALPLVVGCGCGRLTWERSKSERLKWDLGWQLAAGHTRAVLPLDVIHEVPEGHGVAVRTLVLRPNIVPVHAGNEEQNLRHRSYTDYPVSHEQALLAARSLGGPRVSMHLKPTNFGKTGQDTGILSGFSSCSAQVCAGGSTG